MPVLGTKVHLPAPRRALVPRARLTDYLHAADGAGTRLVLVAAPAGFGKTTLLTQWLAEEPARQVAWLALDTGDADVRRFLTHLIAAIQTAEPEAGAEALTLLEATSTTQTDAVLVSLINDLDVIAGPMVLGLDDYHVIDGTDVHEAMAFLLDNLPPHITLAMTTRADPPLPLSRLRARGELVEVRAADLRFSADEAEAFLNEVMGLQLEPELVAALDARTEGWAAGLQLAALSVRSRTGTGGSGDVAGFVEAFSGSHRFVLDYLVEEVLDRQPDEVRDFLLDTAVLDEMTGGLCDALTGRTDGQSMLATLERENLFVIALDDERRWYPHIAGAGSGEEIQILRRARGQSLRQQRPSPSEQKPAAGRQAEEQLGDLDLERGKQAALVINHYATPDTSDAPTICSISGDHAARTARGSTSSSHRSTSNAPST